MPEENKGTEGADDQTKNKSEDGTGDPNLKKEGGDQSGTDPNKKTVTGQPEAFDPSKVGDEDFEKVFDDPRVWKHPRFKNLNDRAKKADEYEKAEETRKAEELKKKGEFETLAKQEEEKRKAAELKLQTAQIDNQIQQIAAKVGAVDLEAVTKLIDRSNIKVNDDGTVTGVEEAVNGLLEAKPFLKGTGQTTNIGSGTNPSGDGKNAPRRFKHSEIQDPAFFKEHEQEIQAAMKAGLIEQDLPM